MNVFLLLLNILCFSFLWLWNRKRRLSLGIPFGIGDVVILLYLFMSIVAVSLFFDARSYYLDLTFFPFFYLFVIMTISFYPLLSFDTNRVKKLVPPNTLLINSFTCVIIVVGIIHAIKGFSDIDNAQMIITDITEMGDVYRESRENVTSGGAMSNIIRSFNNLFKLIYIFLLFYYLSEEKKRYIYIIPLAFIVIMSIARAFSAALRGPIVQTMFDCIFMYFIFMPRFSDKGRSIFKWSFFFIVVVALLGFVYVSLGRFDFGKKNNSIVRETVIYYGKSYAAQSFLNFNNYGLDAGGTREGDKTFPIVKKMLGISYSADFFDRRMKYSNLKMDDRVFYTFVGDFTLDYGPIFAFLILILIAFCYQFFLNMHRDRLSFGQLLILYMLFIKCTHGFTLYPYAETGNNVMLLFMIFFAIVFEFDVEIQERRETEGVVCYE